MQNPYITNLLFFYGTFLIVCGIVAVSFIGMKAKTALISGSMSGGSVLLVAYLMKIGLCYTWVAGIVLALAFLIVFSWRSTKTLQAIFKMIPTQDEGLKGKGIAFLIISLMAVFSLIVLAAQVVAVCGACSGSCVK